MDGAVTSEGGSIWLVLVGLLVVVPVAASRFDRLLLDAGSTVTPVLGMVRVSNITRHFGLACLPYIAPIALIYASVAGALLTGLVTIDLERVWAPVAQILVVFGLAGAGARTEILSSAELAWRSAIHRTTGIPGKLIETARDLDAGLAALVCGPDRGDGDAAPEREGGVSRLSRGARVARRLHRLLAADAPEIASDFDQKWGKMRRTAMDGLENCLDAAESALGEIAGGGPAPTSPHHDAVERKLDNLRSRLDLARVEAAIYLLLSLPYLSKWATLPGAEALVLSGRSRLLNRDVGLNAGAVLVGLPVLAGAALGLSPAGDNANYGTWLTAVLFACQSAALFGIPALIAFVSHNSRHPSFGSEPSSARRQAFVVAGFAFFSAGTLAVLINIAAAASEVGVGRVRELLGAVVFFAMKSEFPMGVIAAAHALWCLFILRAGTRGGNTGIWIMIGHGLALILLWEIMTWIVHVPLSADLSSLTWLSWPRWLALMLIAVGTDRALVRYARGSMIDRPA